MTGEDAERIGELLIEEGIVTQEEITQALAEGGLGSGPLAAALQAARLPGRRELAAFLAGHQIPKLDDLRQVTFQAEAVRAVPQELARKHELVPVARIGGILCVAKSNAFNRAAVLELRRQTGLRIKVLLADEGQVKAALEKLYANRGELPAPKTERKETAVRRPPSEEAMPLISSGAPGSAGRDEPSRVLVALKVGPLEAQELEANVGTRLLREWDDLFVNGRPSPPIRVG